MATLVPQGKQSYTDGVGNPLAGGLLYTYAGGTTTPLATYSDQAGTIPNANPVVLDARGEATIFWGAGPYKASLHDALDAVIWTQDGIYPPASATDLTTTTTGLATVTNRLNGVAATTIGAGLVTPTGATTARPLTAWFSDTLNPRAFGAVGDGVTDDTAAIQAAIDAAYAAGGGTVLLVGRFAINNPGLALKYGVTLYNPAGQAERTNSSYRTGGMLIGLGSTPFNMVTIGSTLTSDMQAGVKGIALFNSPGNGIVINSHAATIQGCSVVDAKQTGIILNAGTTNVLNTHVIRPGRHGIAVNHGDNRIGGGSEVQQPNNSGAGEVAGTYDGIYVAPSVGGTQIYNVRIGDDYFRSRDGIRLDGAWDTQITNADLQNCTVAGLRIRGGHMNSITNSAIWSASTDANKAGIVLEADGGAANAARVAIVAVTLNGTTTAGLGGIVVGTGCSDISILGNTYYGTWLGAAAITGDMAGVNQLAEPLAPQGAVTFGGAVNLGPSNYAQSGTLRFSNNSDIRWRNAADDGDVQIINVATNAHVGAVGLPLVFATSRAAPSGATTDGQFWVECTGTSPARVCALKIRDGGASRTIASVTY